ncbi:MAG: penicillin-binding protein 2 [Actinomycetota bacterium]|nr:penicillin-binding protein 2 [Actinomycetota bacterium]
MYLRRSDTDPARKGAPLSVRATILTGIAIAIFSVVFLRLWYLEVLSGDRYRQMANDNRVREVRVQAPRGDILDRNGKVLVANRTVLALQVQPRELPKPGPRRKSLMTGLESVTGLTTKEIEQEIADVQRESPSSPVVLKQGLGSGKVFYLRENQDRFPGVSVERVFAREYKQGRLAAHLFGNVGEVTKEQLELPRYSTLAQGDLVGQSGIEYEYDRFLRGKAGASRLQVDALGRPTGQLASDPAQAGENVRLTIDSNLQAYAEGALGSFGLPGAFVAMDVDSGEVLAMGSAPSFDPAIFTEPITQRQYRALVSERNDAPLANRATQGLYPTGSVFKVITAIGALQEGLIDPGTIVQDNGELKVDTVTFKNAGDAIFGPIDMSDAFKVSSDIYFYLLGLKAPAEKGGGVIQDWASRLGLGEQTGIDLPAEVDGLIPTPAWRNRLYRQQLTDRPWTAGDNINLAVGQGDLQADPLQMAVVYAALANGGKVLRPHIGESVESVTGAVQEEIRPAPKRQVEISEQTQGTIMEGLRRAAMEEDGTSYPVFGNFPLDVAGKTGTAERGTTVQDQSWYVALAPADDPEIVIAVTVERAGFGVDVAAPIAARMLENHFKLPLTPPVPVPARKETTE